MEAPVTGRASFVNGSQTAIAPVINRLPKVQAVGFRPSQSFSSKMEVDLDEHGISPIRKHEIEPCDIDLCLTAEMPDGTDALLLQLRPSVMIDFSTPADIVIEITGPHPEVAHGMISVDHDA